jgi:phosphoinositide-3-kinase, regulatory subunit 4
VCYVAPERFTTNGENKSGGVTDAMDVFSLGCVIAELFLEGTPLFSLSQMLKYRKGEYDPVRLYVDKIEDDEIKVRAFDTKLIHSRW